MHFRTALVAAIVLVCAKPAFPADIVILNDGTRYDGSIIYQDDGVVIMKIENTAVKIDRSNVIWIAAGSGAPAASAPKSTGLSQAIEILSSQMSNELEKAGHTSVVICPFWGPASDTNGLHERLAAQIARNLKVAGLKTVEPEAIDRVVSALQITRSKLRDNLLAGRIAGILGAQSAVVGQVTSVAQEVVTVQVSLLQAGTGDAIATHTINIAKTDEVRRLLGEELPVVEVVPVAPAAPSPAAPIAPKVVQSAVSSKFTPKFSLAEFHRRFVSGKPESAAYDDTITWLLDSGNKAYVMSEGVVLVTSFQKLTAPGQVKTLENDMASIFMKLAQLTDGFTAAHVHKAVEFDSVYYGHAPGIFHRFIPRPAQLATCPQRPHHTLRQTRNDAQRLLGQAFTRPQLRRQFRIVDVARHLIGGAIQRRRPSEPVDRALRLDALVCGGG